MTRRISAIIAFAAAALVSGTALAHAFLDHSVPPVGSTVATSPPAIRIFFTQPLEPAFSAIAITTADGRTVPTAAATVDPSDPTELVLALPPLPPGRYTVTWHVVSVDTHRTEGDYSFEIGP
jgi:methionine-rich copper-binding protein CopC